MIKIFALERSSGFKMIKCNIVQLLSATFNTAGYYQAIPSNCYRSIFTLCYSIKKNPAIDSSYFGKYDPERTIFGKLGKKTILVEEHRN